jgi:RNA polymerase sigma-70 factor (ECF subfamily)
MALYSADEKEMVFLLKQGDRKAFEYFYRTYNKRIYNSLRKLLHSNEIAEELLQEVFYRLWLKRELLDHEQSFSSYLFRISGNIAYDHFRKAGRDLKLQAHLIATGSEHYDHIDTLIDFKESSEHLEKAISLLPPQRQKIFKLIKIEGMSYDEVATLLGISSSTVNDHIVKATRIVKDQFFSSRETALCLLLAYMLHQK